LKLISRGWKNCVYLEVTDIPRKGYKQTDEHRKKHSESIRGRHLSYEHRKKISSSKISGKHPYRGLHLSEDHRRKIGNSERGENHHFYGKHLSEEHRKKISDANRGRKCKPFSDEHRKKMSDSRKKLVGENAPTFGKCGESAPAWKGGVSFGKYCQKFNSDFKRRVRAFFKNECVECHITSESNGRLLDVHHVNYDKMMCCNDVKPLFVALCRKHNAMANHDREYWEQHYTDIIMNKYGGQCYLPKIAEGCAK
jgi:hypothetical protein